MKTTVPPSDTRRAVATVCALVAVALGGCAPRDTDSSIRVSGNIEVIDAQLSFKIPGRLVERTVDEGDHVAAGALVARIDAIELEQELDLRRAELAAVQAQLAELKAGARPQEIASAEATVQGTLAEQERAHLDFVRQRDLRATDVVAKRDLDNAQASLDVAEARLAEARARRDLVREGTRAETITQASARVAQAQAAVALTETRLDNARLTAPFAGVVLEKHAEPGEFLAAGAPVVSVADTSRVWMRAYLNETDLGRVRLGQPVDVRTDSYPDKTYRGRLAFISSEAEFTPKTVQTQKERVTLVFRIKIDLDNASGELKPGMAADATLEPAAAAATGG